jgi:hypothetical protein
MQRPRLVVLPCLVDKAGNTVPSRKRYVASCTSPLAPFPSTYKRHCSEEGARKATPRVRFVDGDIGTINLVAAHEDYEEQFRGGYLRSDNRSPHERREMQAEKDEAGRQQRLWVS